MNRTLSLTTASAALVLFATSLLSPMQANAADRQISVNPNLAKLKTFTVDTRNEDKAVEVANTTPEAPKNTKRFRVETEETEQAVTEPQQKPKNTKRFRVETEETEQAATEPKLTPKNVKPKAFRVDTEENEEVALAPELKKKQPKVKEFRVDEESGEVADTPTPSDDEDNASTDEDRPVNTLNKKKAPVVADDEQDATSDEDKEEAIAADSPETNAQADDEEAVAEADEDDGEPTILKKFKPGKKVRYVVKHNTYYQNQEDYGYQAQSYDTPSCHNNSYSY